VVARDSLLPRTISQNDLDWFAARLSIAVYDTNRELRAAMGIHELQTSLRQCGTPGAESLTMQYGPAGVQNFIMGDVNVTLPPNASEADILAALSNPFLYAALPAANPGLSPMSITGFQPGAIKAAIDAAKAKAKADMEAAMGKLAAASAKSATVPDAIAQVAASMEKEADDVLQELATFTNGGPAL
jgi:hypothetical protein